MHIVASEGGLRERCVGVGVGGRELGNERAAGGGRRTAGGVRVQAPFGGPVGILGVAGGRGAECLN